MLKMIMLMSCEVAFYKLNISDANFTDKHHLVELNFKGVNLPAWKGSFNKMYFESR